MCGRLFAGMSLDHVRQIARCNMVRNPSRYNPSYNIGPTTYIPVISRMNQSDKKEPQISKYSFKKTTQVNNLQDQGKEGHVQNKTNDNQSLDQIEHNNHTLINRQMINIKDNKNNQKKMHKEKEEENEDKEGKDESKDIQNSQKTNGDIENGCNKNEANSEQNNSVNELDFLQWGLPSDFDLIINCRSEEATDKRTFQPLLKNHRCVVVTQGYYEWNEKKQPFAFLNSNYDYLLLAALKHPKNNQVIVLTRPAFGKFEAVHNRMPVFLDQSDIDRWLDPSIPYADILFKELLNNDRKIHSVIEYFNCSPLVNKVRENSIKCLMTMEEYQADLKKNGISKYFKKQKVHQKPKKEQDATTEGIKQSDSVSEKKKQKEEESKQKNNTQITEITKPQELQLDTQLCSQKNNISKSYYQQQLLTQKLHKQQQNAASEDSEEEENKEYVEYQKMPLMKEIRLRQAESEDETKEGEIIKGIRNSMKKKADISLRPQQKKPVKLNITPSSFSEGLEEFFRIKNSSDKKQEGNKITSSYQTNNNV